MIEWLLLLNHSKSKAIQSDKILNHPKSNQNQYDLMKSAANILNTALKQPLLVT